MARRTPIDKPFLIASIILIIGGFFIFNSASLSLLAKNSANYSSVAFTQTVLGFGLGTILLIVSSRLDYRIWKKAAFPLMLVALILNILVLFFGTKIGGARRWFYIHSFSFQPAEFLKFAFIIYFAAWAAGAKSRMRDFGRGFLPLVTLLAIIGTLLLLQPDTDNFIMIIFAGVAMFLASGGKWRYLVTILLGFA